MPNISLKVTHTFDTLISTEARKAFLSNILESIAESLTDTVNIFLSEYWDNVNPESGKIIKSRRLSKAVAMNLDIHPAGIVDVTLFIAGSKYVQWIANKLEKGGRIIPTSAKVLTVPPHFIRMAERFRYRARQYPEARWKRATPQEVTTATWDRTKTKAERKQARIPVLVQAPPERPRGIGQPTMVKKRVKNTWVGKSPKIGLKKFSPEAKYVVRGRFPHVPEQYQIIYIGRKSVNIPPKRFFAKSVKAAETKFNTIEAGMLRRLEQGLMELKQKGHPRELEYKFAPQAYTKEFKVGAGRTIPAALRKAAGIEYAPAGRAAISEVRAGRMVVLAPGQITFELYQFMDKGRMLAMMKRQGLSEQKLLQAFA